MSNGGGRSGGGRSDGVLEGLYESVLSALGAPRRGARQAAGRVAEGAAAVGRGYRGMQEANRAAGYEVPNVPPSPLVEAAGDYLFQSPVTDTAVTGIEAYLNELAQGAGDREAINRALRASGEYVADNALAYAIPGGERPENRSFAEAMPDAPAWQMGLADVGLGALDVVPARAGTELAAHALRGRTGRSLEEWIQRALLTPEAVGTPRDRPIGPAGLVSEGMDARIHAIMAGESNSPRVGRAAPVASGSMNRIWPDAFRTIITAGGKDVEDYLRQASDTNAVLNTWEDWVEDVADAIWNAEDIGEAFDASSDLIARLSSNGVPERVAQSVSDETFRRAWRANRMEANDPLLNAGEEILRLFGRGDADVGDTSAGAALRLFSGMEDDEAQAVFRHLADRGGYVNRTGVSLPESDTLEDLHREYLRMGAGDDIVRQLEEAESGAPDFATDLLRAAFAPEVGGDDLTVLRRRLAEHPREEGDALGFALMRIDDAIEGGKPLTYDEMMKFVEDAALPGEERSALLGLLHTEWPSGDDTDLIARTMRELDEMDPDLRDQLMREVQEYEEALDSGDEILRQLEEPDGGGDGPE